MLTFRIKGSSGSFYSITAYNEGDSFDIWCTCPASRLGGRLCKHVAALLVGDVTHLVEGFELMDALRVASSGSRHVAWAMSYVPAENLNPKISGFKDIKSVFEAFSDELAKLNWAVEYNPSDGKFGSDIMSLYSRFKNGKRHKKSKITLTYTEFTYDILINENDEVIKTNIRLRTKPWNVNSRSYSTLDRALGEFMRAARGGTEGAS